MASPRYPGPGSETGFGSVIFRLRNIPLPDQLLIAAERDRGVIELGLCLFECVSGSVQISLSLIPRSGNVIAFEPGDHLPRSYPAPFFNEERYEPPCDL
jgi:hypothetical protein